MSTDREDMERDDDAEYKREYKRRGNEIMAGNREPFRCVHCRKTFEGTVNYGGGFGRPLGTWCDSCANEWLTITVVDGASPAIKPYKPLENTND